jgi:dihydropteroate synthase
MSSTWLARGRAISLERPIIMGILNVTPDSFSDGGLFFSVDDAVRHAHALIAEGADVIDVGGESTRPQGARPVSESDEIERVVPVIAGIVAELPDAILSVDTVKSGVARAALDAGARIVNDVSGFRLDDRMADVCANTGAGVVLMHSRGIVSDMGTYAHADYPGDAASEIMAELRQQVGVAIESGVSRNSIAVDPGIGFSKRSEHSLRMLACLDRLVAWGMPVLVGASRKRFIGELTRHASPSERVFGSVGAAVAAYDRGARMFRVHDVAATRAALDVAAAIHAAGAA